MGYVASYIHIWTKIIIIFEAPIYSNGKTKKDKMEPNSEIMPAGVAGTDSGGYCNPVLVKDGSLSRLYRIARAGKYFIVKTVKDGSGYDSSLLKREYELSIGLNHPYIVNVFTFEEHTPVGSGIVMEYIDGRSLGEFLTENPQKELRERVLGQLLDAVAYLHCKGIVHNDLKPENIIISRVDNTLKIIDFGLSGNDAYYLTRNLGCTPQYASPELLENRKTDCRSDIYSLGLLMRDICGNKYGRIWKKAANISPDRRFPNVERIQSALITRKRLLPVGLFVVLLGLALFSFAMVNNLQKQNDSLQITLKELQSEQQLMENRKHYIDSVCNDIDVRMQEIYKPFIELLHDLPSRDRCFAQMSKVAEQLVGVYQSYQNCTSDPELLSTFNSYYSKLYLNYHNKCIDIIDTKP